MSIRMFDTDEDMFAYMEQMRQDGLRAYESMPKYVLDGLRTGHYYAMEEYGLVIFGEIIESEYEEDQEMMARQPHMRLVRAYSEACPYGELGTMWVTRLLPISKHRFEEAKQANWMVPPDIVKSWIRVRLSNLKAVTEGRES